MTTRLDEIDASRRLLRSARSALALHISSCPPCMAGLNCRRRGELDGKIGQYESALVGLVQPTRAEPKGPPFASVEERNLRSLVRSSRATLARHVDCQHGAPCEGCGRVRSVLVNVEAELTRRGLAPEPEE